jgi:DNA polymerase III subunit delta
MTPREFLQHLQKQPLQPAYLFLGPEVYRRLACTRALVEKVLPQEARESGWIRHSLDEMPLGAVIDDACSLSLFASERVIFVGNAELALPKGRAAAAAAAESSDGEEGTAGVGGQAALARYLEDPAPGVVLVFEATRYGFDNDDKARLEKLRKFYASIPAVVEFEPFTESEARSLAQKLAAKAKLEFGSGELDLLVEASGADGARIATEIDKLSLSLPEGGKVSRALLEEMVPDARSRSIFELVSALGRKDQQKSLDVLDTLVRQGEYLPLALTFLSGQLRLALAAHEAGVRGAGAMQAHFSRLGIAMWRSRAEQVAETVEAFSRPQIVKALKELYRADKALRDTRPDDRVVLEEVVLRLTK